MYYYESVLMSGLYQKAEDTHHGVILNIMEQLKAQEWKELVLGYVTLLRETKGEKGRGLNLEDLDAAVESTLRQIVTGREIDFEVEDSVRKLLELGIATKKDNTYYPVSLETASDIIKQKFIQLLK